MTKKVFELSPKFTIEDIHKIREYNYWITKDLPDKDRLRYYNDPDFRKLIEKQNKNIAEIVHVQD